MKRTIGIILTLIGLVSTTITGIQVLEDSDSFNVFGLDVVVSQADYTPFIISVVVLIVGVVLWVGSRRS
ncbi:MAG: hypothetical protein AAGE93_20450 [Bacteroidota bacterium]